MADYNVAKREYEQYEVAVERWEKGEVVKEQPRSVRERLRQAEQIQKRADVVSNKEVKFKNNRER